ncbi:hypothetical protein PR048_004055 [Dryococelus australis]|uniref:Uncharacterized protein n=1 Tax=Dryococelus australis TaxID=614101 RepID=A0ABQ9I4E7_9NEOP|nr:hypothetical protein PR048_004055 [Dryococelus australis]
MGTDSTDDYDETVNANDGMRDLRRGEDDHEESFDDNDYEDGVDEVSDEKDDDSLDVPTHLTNYFPSSSCIKKAEGINNARYIFPEDPNERVGRLRYLIELQKRGDLSLIGDATGSSSDGVSDSKTTLDGTVLGGFLPPCVNAFIEHSASRRRETPVCSQGVSGLTPCTYSGRGKEIMQGDMHRGREGLGSHGQRLRISKQTRRCEALGEMSGGMLEGWTSEMMKDCARKDSCLGIMIHNGVPLKNYTGSSWGAALLRPPGSAEGCKQCYTVVEVVSGPPSCFDTCRHSGIQGVKFAWVLFACCTRFIPGRVTPDFRTWESCRTMPLIGGFSRGPSLRHALSFLRCSVLTSILLIGSQDLAVKSRPNLFTHKDYVKRILAFHRDGQKSKTYFPVVYILRNYSQIYHIGVYIQSVM